MSMDARYRYSQSYAANASIQVPPPTMTSQRFCLRWNNHQSNLLSVFDQLLHDESFVDVTIGVEGQYLKAHKMVLSACSPYFQALFVSTPDKHPIVILKDVPYADMRSLLDFMYRGEVSVDQDRLTAFLRVAENLRIKGLTEVNEDKCDIPSITSSLLSGNGGNNNNNVQNTMSHSSHRMPPAPPRRPAGQLMSPLLGNALAQPKRKRGRPRKLSGSSNGAPSLDAEGSPIVRGSPEMLEVKMNMDGFQGSESDIKRDTDVEGDDGNEIDDKSDIQKENQEQPVAGTSREQEGYHNNEFHAENHQLYLENNQNHSNTQPSVTFELITASAHVQSSKPVGSGRSSLESVIISTENVRNVPVIQSPMLEPMAVESPGYDKQEDMESSTGVHFLTDEENDRLLIPKLEKSDNYESETVKTKSDLLEYLIRNDGSVICKLCGEILASRTHWYRHKYRIHVNNPANPAPLFKCTRCNIFFKSRKGYIGHISSRHTEEEPPREDSSPGATSITELISVETEPVPKTKKRLDGGNTKSTDWEQQREKEEKLVADIIDRVRRECEAQGATVTRRGYSRRTTVMNS